MTLCFQPRGRGYATGIVLALLLSTLSVTLCSWQRQQQLTTALAGAAAELQLHRQAADAIRARQHAASHAPQPSRARLTGLSLLAQAWRGDIALLSLDMAPGEQRIHLTVLSDSLETLLDFVTRLQRLPASVSLEHHQRDNTLPEPWKIRARLTLEYRDAS